MGLAMFVHGSIRSATGWSGALWCARSQRVRLVVHAGLELSGNAQAASPAHETAATNMPFRRLTKGWARSQRQAQALRNSLNEQRHSRKKREDALQRQRVWRKVLTRGVVVNRRNRIPRCLRRAAPRIVSCLSTCSRLSASACCSSRNSCLWLWGSRCSLCFDSFPCASPDDSRVTICRRGRARVITLERRASSLAESGTGACGGIGFLSPRFIYASQRRSTAGRASDGCSSIRHPRACCA